MNKLKSNGNWKGKVLFILDDVFCVYKLRNLFSKYVWYGFIVKIREAHNYVFLNVVFVLGVLGFVLGVFHILFINYVC